MKKFPAWLMLWPGVLWAVYGALFFEESVYIEYLKFILFFYIAMAPMIYYLWKD